MTATVVTTRTPPKGRPTNQETTMLDLATARAEALFTSDLSAGPHSRAEVDAAIRQSVRDHHGVRGCAADMAYQFGRHPIESAARMCWCRTAVREAYGSEPLAVAA